MTLHARLHQLAVDKMTKCSYTNGVYVNGMDSCYLELVYEQRR